MWGFSVGPFLEVPFLAYDSTDEKHQCDLHLCILPVFFFVWTSLSQIPVLGVCRWDAQPGLPCPRWSIYHQGILEHTTYHSDTWSNIFQDINLLDQDYLAANYCPTVEAAQQDFCVEKLARYYIGMLVRIKLILCICDDTFEFWVIEWNAILTDVSDAIVRYSCYLQLQRSY